ncbi:MAG TPA: FAD-dependent thymidylate synthase [Anaerolineaceae bacterium]|nr:FAD-dependent thymidylate synthase [Anaerolineaceae bacterium]
MNSNRQIYLLNPQELRPETIAVAFAKTSRSPESFRDIAAELTDEKSAQFHEKWVVGYGHSSVAEHAVLHIAIENVSRLAIETLESNRLASYTEKSTRYQKWNPDAYYIPKELHGSHLEQVYQETCQALFAAYQQALPAVHAVIARGFPQWDGESEAAWDRRIRVQYVDVCRYLLPASSLANLGMTANARVLEHAICKLLSHPLEEVREIGAEIKHVAQQEVPTLVKYAHEVPYLKNAYTALSEEAPRIQPAKGPQFSPEDWCCLVDYDPAGEETVLAAALYRFGEIGFSEALQSVRQASPAERLRLADILLAGAGEFDSPLRELEHTTYTFDVMVDQGAYFELKRHRMMTQSPQMLTTRNGYAVPKKIVEAGLESFYREAMDRAGDAYEKLAGLSPAVGGYVVPNGYYRRVLLTLNLRNAFHLCSLRSAANAHFSMRRLALRMAEQIRGVHPVLGAYIRVEGGDDWQSVDAQNFVG